MDKKTLVLIGRQIREARNRADISRRELARRTGDLVSHATIRLIEEADTENPGAGTLLAIAEALGVALVAPGLTIYPDVSRATWERRP
jgi:transcriptional regulator with XRE-family HTH domain